jgi:hypothetical protein
MIIQGLGNAATLYAAAKTLPMQRQISDTPTANFAYKVSISAAASKAFAADSSVPDDLAIQKRLDGIKSKPAVERTDQDVSYLHENDKKLAEITAKDPKTLKSSEIDYIQKSGGFVNTMSALSDQEKAMYDEMIAQGNYDAAQGLNMVAMTRYGMDNEITLPNGNTFNPGTTEVTAANVRNLFRFTFVDGTGEAGRKFDALAAFLDQREAQATKA